MPINQMIKNKDRPHSYAFAQVGCGIILESALCLRKFDSPVCHWKAQLALQRYGGRRPGQRQPVFVAADLCGQRHRRLRVFACIARRAARRANGRGLRGPPALASEIAQPLSSGPVRQDARVFPITVMLMAQETRLIDRIRQCSTLPRR
jgi:hypothetical protein